MSEFVCPEAEYHGNPFRYCGVKGCGWFEPSADVPDPPIDPPINAPDLLERLRHVNVNRARRWHGDFRTYSTRPIDRADWIGVDWANAAAGEMGEACNVVKKLRRKDSGLSGANDPDGAELREMLGDEIADTIIYLDLLAAYYGIDLRAAIVAKFDRVSEREGFPERLGSVRRPLDGEG